MAIQKAIYCDCVEMVPGNNGEPAYEVGAIVLNTRNLDHCQTLRDRFKKIDQENTSSDQQ